MAGRPGRRPPRHLSGGSAADRVDVVEVAGAWPSAVRTPRGSGRIGLVYVVTAPRPPMGGHLVTDLLGTGELGAAAAAGPVVLLGCPIGAELAAVALAPVLRPVDERPGARRRGADPEAADAVRADDLGERGGRGRAEMLSDRLLPGPEPNRPGAVGLLEMRDRLDVRENLVQRVGGFGRVARLEDDAESAPEALDLPQVAVAGHPRRLLSSDDAQEPAEPGHVRQVLGRVVVGVPRVDDRDRQVRARLRWVTEDHALTPSRLVSLKKRLDTDGDQEKGIPCGEPHS